MDEHEIKAIIHCAIDELGERRKGEAPTEINDPIILLDFDSMQLINLLLSVESSIERTTGKSLRLVEDPDLLEEDGPLCSVERFASYMGEKLK